MEPKTANSTTSAFAIAPHGRLAASARAVAWTALLVTGVAAAAPRAGVGTALGSGPAATVAAVIGVTDYDEVQPLDVHSQASVAIVDRLRHYHFKSKPLDDGAASEIFDKYLEFLDPKRSHFLASDVAALEKYRLVFDDALQDGDLEPAFTIYNRYRRRALERIEYETKLLQRGLAQFDFSLEEAVELDRKEAPRPTTKAQAEELWRLELKSRVLGGKLAGDPLDTISEALTKSVKNRLRLIRQTRSEDVFQIYVHAFTQTYDRHTQYFSPQASEDFNIFMSLSLEGIGAVLGLRDEYTVVQRLVKGGPADLGGVLQPADRIVAVSQSANEPFVDIVGWRTDEVVQLIRGPKGSPVLLKVIPAEAAAGETRVVEIVRNVVKLEDQSASKSLLTVNQDGHEYRVGVVVLPTFYFDFKAQQAGDPNFRSATRDVARLIDELKTEGMDALVIDLRNNGGGSLQAAVDLAGLFLDSGPVVQVTNLRHRPHVYGDNDGVAAWRGPLAVMVNGLSASASEIFAGAVQDHGLGLVVGSKTFGKGTVQTLIDLRRGELKLTTQQFYRVSGDGTEQNGVDPDIAYPVPEGRLRARDRGKNGVIKPGSKVSPARYLASNRVMTILPALRGRHQQRASVDPEFAYLRARKEHLERLQERTHLSLREQTRVAEKAADEALALKLENARLTAKGEEPVATMDELNARREAEALKEAAPEDDTLVRETANILIDFIGLSLPLAMVETPAQELVQ